MKKEYIFAGFGGQGMLLIGKFLAMACMLDGKHVSWLPSYGPEMRGGTANCSVVLSDKPVGSPVFAHPTELIALNEPSLVKFEEGVVPGGMVFVNSDVVTDKVSRTDLTAYYIPCSQIADEVGNPKVSNMVMLGAYVAGTKILKPETIEAMIQEMFPNAKTVGLLYCSAEPNSVYQCDVIEGYLTEMGLETTRYAFTDTNDVTSVTQAAAAASDVIYIPTDNTAASNTEAIANVVIPEKVPVVAGEEGICKGCGVAALSISYYDLGYKTGEMAAEILADGADVSTMPVAFAPNVTKKYNAANCEALGITPPDGYEAIAD